MSDEDDEDAETVYVRIPVEVELYLAGVEGTVMATGMFGMDFDFVMGEMDSEGPSTVGRAIASSYDDHIADDLKQSFDDHLVFQNPLTAAIFRAKKDNVIAFTTYPPSIEAIGKALDEAASSAE